LALAVPAPLPRLPFRFDLSWPILIGFAAALCLLILMPLSWLVYYSFHAPRRRLHPRNSPSLSPIRASLIP
jgi:peptidoglycan/LPS O-acetylase OafA/YrhL